MKRLLHGKRLVVIGVCVTDETRKALKKSAKKSKKTLSSYAAHILTSHLESSEVAA